MREQKYACVRVCDGRLFLVGLFFLLSGFLQHSDAQDRPIRPVDTVGTPSDPEDGASQLKNADSLSSSTSSLKLKKSKEDSVSKETLSKISKQPDTSLGRDQIRRERSGQDSLAGGQKLMLPFSDDLLNRFSKVYPQLIKANDLAQDTMVAIIKKNGLTLEEFNQIQTGAIRRQKIDPDKKMQDAFKSAKKELDAIRPRLQNRVDSVLRSGNLNIKDFRNISKALRRDTALQSRVRKLMKEKKE